MRARPATSLAQPRYSQLPMVELIFGVPVQDGRAPVEVDEELVVTGILSEIASRKRGLQHDATYRLWG